MEDKNPKKLILAFSRETEIRFGRINNSVIFFNPLIFRKIYVYIHECKTQYVCIHMENEYPFAKW